MITAIRRSFLGWLVLLGTYLVMAGDASPPEVMAGGAAALGAVLLTTRMRRYFKTPLHIKGVWLLFLWRIPFAMFHETWQLTVMLSRRVMGREIRGRFIEHPMPGEADDRHATARTAFMAFGVCITPNSYLVHYDSHTRTVLIRQLAGRELSRVDRLFVELP